jgi:kinetochore protein Spc7/SPC105
MDMTTVMNPGNYPATGSAILDEEFDYDDNIDNDDMDITEAIQGNFARKRSSSIGRRSLSRLQSPSETDDEVNESRSDHTNESMQSSASDEQSLSMEFTVPLGQSLHPGGP